MRNEQLTDIETLGEFMEWVDQLSPRKCLFRGLSNQEHSTEASAWRRLTHEQDANNIDKLLEINRGLIRDVRLRGYDEKDGRKLSDLEILAELQHFRAATFLIDFSYSPQVALWFACQQSFKEPPNSKELSDGKVEVVFVDPDRIIEVTPEFLNQDISVFFETDTDGRYPLYYWEPGEFNTRIPPQHSVFLFGGDRIIKPDKKCIITADNKRLILESIEGFTQTNEETLFPDFEGFVYRRTQNRPYVPEGYENYRAGGYRAFQRRDYENAIRHFDEAINLNPTEPDVHYLRGEARYYLHQYSEAASDFDTAIALKDDDLNYYRLRGYTQLALGQFNEAKDDLEKALELIDQIDENINIIDSIRSKLYQIALQTTQGDQWTPERFKELVPKDIRAHYDTQVENEELYRLGAELQSLIQEKGWGLEPRFGRYYFVYRFWHQPTFGVNLGYPRLADIWEAEEDDPNPRRSNLDSDARLTIWKTWEMMADNSNLIILPQLDFSELAYEPTYDPMFQRWVFPPEATVDELRDIFESVYKDVRAKQLPLDGGGSYFGLFRQNQKK